MCACAVKSRAQLHGDVSSEVMVTSVWSPLECGMGGETPTNSRGRGRKELSFSFCVLVLNDIDPSSSTFSFMISIPWSPQLCGHQIA